MPGRQAVVETQRRLMTMSSPHKLLKHYLYLKNSKWASANRLAKELRTRTERKYTSSWVQGELAKLTAASADSGCSGQVATTAASAAGCIGHLAAPAGKGLN